MARRKSSSRDWVEARHEVSMVRLTSAWRPHRTTAHRSQDSHIVWGQDAAEETQT